MAFGRLERAAGSPPMSEINMTPLVDVMLVLLVIFMLAAPLVVRSLRLDLPPAASATPPVAAPVVQLALDQGGQLYWHQQPVGAEALAQRLAEVARRHPQAEVQLRADAAVPYGRVVALMDLVRQAGLSRVGLAAKP